MRLSQGHYRNVAVAAPLTVILIMLALLVAIVLIFQPAVSADYDDRSTTTVTATTTVTLTTTAPTTKTATTTVTTATPTTATITTTEIQTETSPVTYTTTIASLTTTTITQTETSPTTITQTETSPTTITITTISATTTTATYSTSRTSITTTTRYIPFTITQYIPTTITATSVTATSSATSTTEATSVTTISGGGAMVDQTSTTGTGVTMTGSTAPDGTSVTVISQLLGSTQPPGTGSVSLAPGVYFDVQVLGITDGTARVCINNAAVTSGTQMQYWDGTQWVGAASQTIMGAIICGEIPVSALQGTAIVIQPPPMASVGGTVVTMSCTKASLTVGAATACKATVSGSSPTGSVLWTSSSTGTFSSASCNLSKQKSFGACSVKFTPTAAGSTVVLTASYGGDTKNSASAGTYILTVTMKATKTTVSCKPTSAAAGTPITCTAKVTGYSPTGAVSWSQSGTGSVAFPSTSCTLSQGTCSVTLTGSTAGKVTLQAMYGGDANNRGSSGTVNLTIKSAT